MGFAPTKGWDLPKFNKRKLPNNNDRATSSWKCPDCDKESKGHTFKWIMTNGTVTCDCGCNMDLVAVVIDGVSQDIE